MTRRTRRSVAGSVLVVLGLVIGAVIATALQAEGRERSKADTNDGGAWLLKRDAGYVGHVNREVGEITAAVSVSDPGSDFDVDQAQGVIVVHDATKGTVTVVDDSVERVANPTGMQVGSDVDVHAVDGGALIVDDSSMRVWKLTREQLLSAGSTDEIDPVISGEGKTLSAAFPDGNAAFVDEKAGDVVFLRPDGSTAKSGTTELNDDTATVTMLGADRAVFADTDGDLVVAKAGGAATPLGIDVLGADGEPAALALQQPTAPADHVIAATTDGRVVSIPVDGGEGAAPSDVGQLGGTDPVAPIAFGGCVFAVATKPATFTQWCGDGTDKAGHTTWKEIQTVPLDGAGSELRLRLVNGWVWINDVDTGAAWVTSPQQRIDRVQDWGNILSQLTDDSSDDDTDQQGGNVVTEVNPDDPTAEIVQSDQIDQDGPNKPPIARDDQAETRVDRPIDIDVLANDTDPNGDVLVVTSVQPAGGDAQLAIAPDGRSVQVTPAAGFTGNVTFGYTITDGRDASASANVGVEVRPSDGSANRPPVAHNDIASTRRGRPTTFDVLANDTDPDGDALVLDTIALKDPGSAAGQIVPDPSGEVVFTPDPNTTEERIELTYTVSDDFGATDDGTVIVSVRLADANNEPDARNDSGVTVVGKPVRMDVLANDTDPDDDPLFVAQQPTLVRPTDRTIDSLDVSLTPDGELFFDPDAPGTYVFNYSATDGEETDVAQIRVEVGAATENRPPTAIRDDVVIPAGGSRLVHVLDNDGDPDGDVIGLVGDDVEAGNGLTVKEVSGVGYLVTVAPGAPARPTFRYQISDGKSDPVSAVVVVAVTKAVTVNQPPVARADVVEVRAGGKVNVPVLANDYDPEGGTLTVSSVTPFDGVDVAPGLNGQTVNLRVGANVLSSFTISYTVADAAGNQASAFLDVRIVPAAEVNRPPTARTDIGRTRSGVPVVIEAVANDSDPDGDIIAVESIHAQPTGGTAAIESGAVVYTPNATFVGTDRFTYTLVDAGGEIAIGEVLIGVMPAAGANRAPEAFDDTVQAVAGSAPLVYDVLENDSDPDGDTLPRHDGRDPVQRRHQGRRRRRGDLLHPAGAAGRRQRRRRGVHVRRRRRPRRHGIGHRHRARRRRRCAPAPDRRRRPGGPAEPGPVRRRRRPDERPRPGRRPRQARRRLDRHGAGAQGRRDVHGHRRHHVRSPRVHDHRPGRADRHGRGRRARRAEPRAGGRPARHPDRGRHTTRDRPHGAGDGSRRRHHLLLVLRQPAGRLGDDHRQRRRPAEGDVHARHRLLRTGGVRLHGRRPEGTQRLRRRGDQRAGAVQPASRRHRHDARRRGRHADEHRPRRAGDRSRRRRHVDVRHQRSGAGRCDADAVRRHRPGIGTDRRRRPDRLVHLHRHRLGRPVGRWHGVADGPAAGRAAAAGASRRGDDEPGPGGHRRRARQRHRSARARPDRGVGRRHARRCSDHRRAAGDVLTERRLLRSRLGHLPHPRRGQHGVTRVGGAGRHHGDRDAVGAGHADRPRGQRHRGDQLGRPTVERRTDRRLRAAHRRRREPLGRHGHRVHLERADQRRRRVVQRAGPQQRRLGAVERFVAGRHAGHRAGSAGRTERAVRRRRPARVVVTADQRGQRDHELRHPDRRRPVGHPAHRRRQPVPLGGPGERSGVHVPGPRRERQGRGRVQLALDT